MQEIHEECGVFGAWSPKPQNLAETTESLAAQLHWRNKSKENIGIR